MRVNISIIGLLILLLLNQIAGSTRESNGSINDHTPSARPTSIENQSNTLTTEPSTAVSFDYYYLDQLDIPVLRRACTEARYAIDLSNTKVLKGSVTHVIITTLNRMEAR